MKKVTLFLGATILLATSAHAQWTTSGSTTTTPDNVAIQSGQIDLTIPGDGAFRNINANSSTQGLTISVGTNGAGIGMRASSCSDRPGTIGLTSAGPSTSSTSPTGIMYYYFDGTNWNNLMHIWNDGKVTIGTELDAWVENSTGMTPGDYRLYVSHGILTDKLKVAMHSDPANWSDFVFAKDYTLMPLAKVEDYVTANKHLPEIPSAKDVAKDGIDVASMDAKLLQKIEELTLYAIQQQKQIETQQKEIDALKKGAN
ncbi:MAG TPA: hypothetical protein VN721_10825 [Flavipsychrobacter sp.]|nr:hypothetical protein [Flavipsychrobacter sp.]